jgi:2,5-dioxopentanoate dehydrogenase
MKDSRTHQHETTGGGDTQHDPERFHAIDPRDGSRLEPGFDEATPDAIRAAGDRAGAAAHAVAAMPAARRASFLRAIAARMEADGAAIVERADRETALGLPRLQGELARTTGQLRMFAALLDEGSFVGARIDPALPDRRPLPRPDLRRMTVAIGPVAVFGASNFPLAFSVAGGDTASALAAGCPVIVKAHPAHPGTSQLVADAILAAAREEGMPDGTFALMQGRTHATGAALVAHPAVAAVGFTGSFAGGTALMGVAAARERPIPVFAEMGSTNPVIVLPGAARERGDAIADALAASVTQGVGQFCTNPGIVVAAGDAATDTWALRLATRAASGGGAMLTAGILSAYRDGVAARSAYPGVRLVAAAEAGTGTSAEPVVHEVDADAFVSDAALHGELFGPATLVVRCGDAAALRRVAAALPGSLTVTLHLARGEERDADLELARELLPSLVAIAGRVLVDGVPTGVEVAPAMHHGGPWPSSSDVRATSVGTAAIERFSRPICFQDVPAALLPEALRDENPLGIWRLVDGAWTNDGIGSSSGGSDGSGRDA